MKKRQLKIFLIVGFFFIRPFSGIGSFAGKNQTDPVCNFSTGEENAGKFGVHEIILNAETAGINPFDINCRVIFTSPSKKKWIINAFYDGDCTWRARVYVNESGDWEWQSSCGNVGGLNNKKGYFLAQDSSLPGMLHRAHDNPRQWRTDNGKWFLNISDTAYLLFNESENDWKAYVEDLSKLGVTSVRAGSLGGETWDKESVTNDLLCKAYPGSRMDNYPWEEGDQTKMNLQRFRLTDERLIWMLNNHPDIYIQFILFGMQTWGEDDTGQLWKAVPPDIRNKTMEYMIARWSAFPQLFYLIVNDMHCSEKYPHNQEFVREVGRYFAQNDPWHHLISAGPNRHQKFPFLNSEDLEWVSYIHIEDLLATDAGMVELYRQYPLHVFLGEDWYEQTRLDRCNNYLYNPDYFYRWLFWSWTLSGGSANYGGRWAKIHPYFSTDSLLYIEPLGGETNENPQTNGTWTEIKTSEKIIHAKYNTSLKGLNSVKYLVEFFRSRDIDLVKFVPDPEFDIEGSGHEVTGKLKLMRKDYEEFIIYDPNVLNEGSNTLINKDVTASFSLNFGDKSKTYTVNWYNPINGRSIDGGVKKCCGKVDFIAPWKGVDVVLHLKGHP